MIICKLCHCCRTYPPSPPKNASLIGVHNFLQADYEFDELTDSFKRLYRYDEKHFSSNLSTILEWSPFNTEGKLLAQVRVNYYL